MLNALENASLDFVMRISDKYMSGILDLIVIVIL